MKLITLFFSPIYKYWLFSISKTNNSKLKLGVIFLYCLCFWKNEVLAQDRIYFNDTAPAPGFGGFGGNPGITFNVSGG